MRPFSGFFGRLLAGLFVREEASQAAGPRGHALTSPATLLALSESIADLEYAIKTHEKFKTWFSKWLRFHIVISVILYALMALHIYFAIYFGLRWLE